jgi:DNA invertase Pin-like site-specific DNA recombinase
MNSELSPLLQKFSKKEEFNNNRDTSICVIYTRVSSKEQAENNTSLESQKRYCNEFAERKHLKIAEYFGGTFESAKQDERKEFKRMIEFVRKNDKIDTILVYSYDRFSRSGANAAFLSQELQKIGIKVIAVSQEIDTTNPSGRLHRDMLYLFSQFDNELRKDKVVKGMIENLRQGYWVGSTPFGYVNLNRKDKAKNHKYCINQDGELLKIGFELKAKGGITNQDIVSHLHRLGCKIHYKSFVRIICNPFYCGYITNSLIPNELIKGHHPALVSEELFLKANDVILQNPRNGIPKKFKTETLPLKGFAKDEISLSPFTGYQQKGIFYYKSRHNGTCVNVNAEYLNSRFKNELNQFEFNKDNFGVIRDVMVESIETRLQSRLKEQQQAKKQLAELNTKIENLEERFVQGQMENALFEKFKNKYQIEKDELVKMISTEIDSSNLINGAENCLEIAENISEVWSSSQFDEKRRLQSLIYPEGILYNKPKDTIRTPRINSLFSTIPILSSVSKEMKRRKLKKSTLNSHLVASTGLIFFMIIK